MRRDAHGTGRSVNLLYAYRMVNAALDALCDAEAAFDSQDARDAIVAARACVLVAAALANVAAPGSSEPASLAVAARKLLEPAARDAERDEAARRQALAEDKEAGR